MSTKHIWSIFFMFLTFLFGMFSINNTEGFPATLVCAITTVIFFILECMYFFETDDTRDYPTT